MQAHRCWQLIANGSGGIDWAGLPIAAEYLGVSDVEGLIDRLLVIRAFVNRPQDGAR